MRCQAHILTLWYKKKAKSQQKPSLCLMYSHVQTVQNRIVQCKSGIFIYVNVHTDPRIIASNPKETRRSLPDNLRVFIGSQRPPQPQQFLFSERNSHERVEQEEKRLGNVLHSDRRIKVSTVHAPATVKARIMRLTSPF